MYQLETIHLVGNLVFHLFTFSPELSIWATRWSFVKQLDDVWFSPVSGGVSCAPLQDSSYPYLKEKSEGFIKKVLRNPEITDIIYEL